jgi:imidazolonepropionase-like amidohydrolase
LHDELQILVEGGLSPLEALQTSVVNGPEFFGLSDRYGAIEVGKKADLLLLNANPLQDIGATRAIYALVRMGKVYPRADLDDMLLELAQRNAE